MNQLLHQRFHDTASALAYSLAAAQAAPEHPDFQPPYNDLTAFVLRQHQHLPDYLRVPLLLATLGFDGCGFHRRPPQARSPRIAAWKNSRFAFARDLIRYHESLVTFALYSRNDPTSTAQSAIVAPPAHEHPCEIAVIGSGPGGSITACLLAEAGRDVLLIEEGEFRPLESCPPFSKDELVQKYRHGGQTVAMGASKITYVEACCVGGGSEINSALYHRTPPDILEHWRNEFQVQALTEADLGPHFEANERDLSVSPLDRPAPAASLKLHEGAQQLGWKSLEVPRWFRNGTRQSMTETFIPRFLKAGGKLLSQTRVTRLRQASGGWLLETQRSRIHAGTVFVCGGAVQTPALLLRSGLGHNVGQSLRMHPTVKITARFPDVINSADMGVPVHQVKEFAPRLSFGGSISSQAHLALGLLDHPEQLKEVYRAWPNMANYYAMITSEGHGQVSLLPGFRAPLVRYQLTTTDRRNLADGLLKLAELLFAANAVALAPSMRGPALFHRDHMAKLPDVLPPGTGNLMTIHLFSSCPMGEVASRCATDSFGRVHGTQNLFINDASLLCTAPGVNPQGTIMALARRNTLHFLGK